MSTPEPMFPEMTSAEIVFFVAFPSMVTPSPPLDAAAVPAAVRPIRSSVIVSAEPPLISTPLPLKSWMTRPFTVLPAAEAVRFRPTVEVPAPLPLSTITGARTGDDV